MITIIKPKISIDHQLIKSARIKVQLRGELEPDAAIKLAALLVDKAKKAKMLNEKFKKESN